MGWGTKKSAGAKPQPLPALDYEGPERSEKQAAALNAKYAPERKVGKHPALAAPYSEEPAEKPSEAVKAEMAWAKLRSKKGWVPETVAMVLYEFVKDQSLFADLVTFAKRRK